MQQTWTNGINVMTVPSSRLVRNASPVDHIDALTEVLAKATKISIAVAFMKSTGLKKVDKLLNGRLKAGAAMEIFVGRDFCLTQPVALDDLLKLSKRYPSLKVYVAKAEARSTFHPKLYLGIGDTEARILIGSANLTGGALAANHEISVLSTLDLNDTLVTQVEAVFADYRGSRRFEVLDSLVLERYRLLFKIVEDAKSRVERELAASATEMFDLDRLTVLHQEFLQNKSEIEALKSRRRDRKSAYLIQCKIAKMHTLPTLSARDRADFETHFRNLVTRGDNHKHLWHSGDIHRRGQAALKQPKKTIALFALAETAAKLPIDKGYGLIRTPASAIAGVGINMVSEILCTFAPTRYAVFNGNTAAALRLIGAGPPNGGSLFSPSAYARVCSLIDAVRERIGASDLSEADAFLNWIYQEKVKRAE
jgi:HKD family nuclease